MVRALRWVLFVPVGMVLQNVLQMIPPILAAWVFPIEIASVLLRLAVAVVVVVVGGSLLLWLGGLVYVISVVSCRQIAPRLRVAQIIYGAAVAVLGLCLIVLGVVQSAGFLINAYNVAFYSVSLLGVVQAGRLR
jgi:phosphoglycerol transferase MdoB-like AlkP superfamily enzyme